MVPNILQLILVFRTDLKLRLHFVLIPPPDRVSKHLLLHCANVTFLLEQSRVFFFVGIASPYLLAAPRTQALSKAPLFAPPPLATPTQMWLHSVSPRCWAESSLRGTHWSRQQEQAAADFPQPTEAMAHAPPWTARPGARRVGGDPAEGARTTPSNRFLHAPSEGSLSLVSSEEGSHRKETQHRDPPAM